LDIVHFSLVMHILKTVDRNKTDPEICFKFLPIKVPYVSIENQP